jgi:hypothetical protein
MYIYRDLLEDFSNESVRDAILEPLQAESRRIQTELGLKDPPVFLPAKTILNILENNIYLRLQRSQILGIYFFIYIFISLCCISI